MNKNIQLLFALIILILLALNFALYLEIKKLTTNNSRRIYNLELVTSENVSALQKQSTTQLSVQGIYLNNECVPALNCPSGYHPEIYAQPISFANVEARKRQYAPITNFHTYLVGKSVTSPGFVNEIQDCTSKQIQPCKNRSGELLKNDGRSYWRLCMSQGLTKTGPSVNGAASIFTQCTRDD